jgi:similar to stage IV sporulation protein
MLLEKITNHLKGQVRIRAVCCFPERILNLCGARKLCFWNVCWVSPTEFTCEMCRKDWYALRRASKNLDCTLTVEEKAGVPFFLGRFRRRHALLIGLAICGALLFFGSFFIWDFTIEGNTTVSDEEILRSLQRNGVHIGTFGFDLDAEDLRNHVLLEIPDLSWITVNVSGCQAQVQVRERIPKPTLADKRTPANVVARRDGLVLKVQALDGEKLVLPGTTVEAGQILISGVEDTDTFGARIVAGMGEVYARTWYTLTTRMPLTVEGKACGGKEHTRFSLIFGTDRIKFYGSSSYSEKKYDKIMTRTQLHLFGLPLPVTAEEETYRPYTAQTEEVSPVEAEKRAEAILTAYLQTLLDEKGRVSSTLCSSKRSGDTLTVTLKAECVEQIGRSEPIYTDTNETDG